MQSVRMLHSISARKSNPTDKDYDLKTDAFRIIPTGAVFYVKPNYELPLIKGLPDLIGYNQMIYL